MEALSNFLEKLPMMVVVPYGEKFMRIDFYGLVFETPRVTFYLWSPWRAAALEHRLF